jgi:uncharacterized protein
MTRLRRLLLVLGFAVALVGSASCAKGPRPDQPEPSAEEIDKLIGDDRALSPEQVNAAEERLRRDPDDVPTRLRLIAYCSRGRGEGGPSGEPYDSLVLGMIERHPRWKLASEMFLSRGESFDKGARLWLSLAKANPRDAKILGNAGVFLTGDAFNSLNRDQWAQGEALLSEARRLEPGNPRWPEKLGQIAQQEIDINAPPALRRAQATKAMAYLETAYQLTPEPQRRALLYSTCEPMAQVALQAGDTARAKRYATLMLEPANQQKNSWNYGNTIHHAHTVLGLIALQEGRMEEAKTHLLDSARHRGSPQLNSFGPSIDLASELLARGERETVLQYLDLCAAFWKDVEGRLPRWKAAIRAGGTPEGFHWRTASTGAAPAAPPEPSRPAPEASRRERWLIRVLQASLSNEVVHYGPSGAATRKAANGAKWLGILVEVTPPAGTSDLPLDAMAVAAATGPPHPALAIAGFDEDAPAPTYVFFEDVRDPRKLSFPATRFSGPGWGYISTDGKRVGVSFSGPSTGRDSSLVVDGAHGVRVNGPAAKAFLLFETTTAGNRFELQIDGRRDAAFEAAAGSAHPEAAIESACRAGEAKECFRLAELIRTGAGVPTDRSRETELLRKACAGGYGRGCTFLATRYVNGDGVGKNEARGIVLFQKACDLGDEIGCTSVGMRYLQGEGVVKDQRRAVAIFQKACGAGGTLACTDLGFAYASGAGVSRDPNRAIELYRRACDGRLPLACTNLSKMYAPTGGVNTNDAVAAEAHRKGCDNGDAWSCGVLGDQYQRGLGVARDLAAAARYFALGCKGGEAWACGMLGELYWVGGGVTKDAPAAASMYSRACEGNVLESCTNLGLMYIRGIGLSKDEQKGRALLQRACSGGYRPACQEIK